MNDRILWLSIAGALIAAICLGCGTTTLYYPDGSKAAQTTRVLWPSPDLRAPGVESGTAAWGVGGKGVDQIGTALQLAIPLAAQYAMSRPSPVPLPAASQPAK